MTDHDPWQDPRARRWITHVRHQVLPMIQRSKVAAIITPADPDDLDVQQCVEIGASILLDKPLLVIVAPGRKVPAALRRAADKVIEGPADVTAAAVAEWIEAHR